METAKDDYRREKPLTALPIQNPRTYPDHRESLDCRQSFSYQPPTANNPLGERLGIDVTFVLEHMFFRTSH